MREQVEKVFHVVETAKKAMEEVGIIPKVVPIRGGTDGARLSYMDFLVQTFLQADIISMVKWNMCQLKVW